MYNGWTIIKLFNCSRSEKSYLPTSFRILELCGNMVRRLVIRGEILSILRVSGSSQKAFSAATVIHGVFRFRVFSILR